MTATDTREPRSTSPEGDELCAVCGQAIRNAFCHLYGEAKTVSLCSPACAEIYLHRPTGRSGADLSFFAASAIRDVA